MKINGIKTITARDFGSDCPRMITMRPSTRKAEYANPVAPAEGMRLVKRIDFGAVLGAVKRWLYSAGPDDVTYYGTFDNEDQFEVWRGELFCEDYEVVWDVTVEYTSGAVAAFVCTGNQPFPEVFDKACMSAEKEIGGAA